MITFDMQLTKTLLSGIPVASVGQLFFTSSMSSQGIYVLYDLIIVLTGNARALTDEGQTPQRLTQAKSLPSSDADSSQVFIASGLMAPTSPNRRTSLTPSGTTKVLADLQTGVTNARNALENTKTQLRISQRTVAQLTRQTEDLKEARERLRLENEGLNNVVARKERLLQEVSRSLTARRLFTIIHRS